MGFNPSGGKLQNAGDVGFGVHNTFPPSSSTQFLNYNSTDAIWENTPLDGIGALANKGGLETVSTNSSATGATALNLANGNVFNITLVGDVTFTFSGATAGKACSFGLYLSQDATGSHAVTWPTVKWAGGTAPTLTTTANATDVLVFETIDGGTTWYGSLVGANFS